MDWLRYAAIAALLGLATAGGGAIVRIAVVAEDLRTAVVLALVALLLLVTVAAGARGRRWRQNPYW